MADRPSTSHEVPSLTAKGRATRARIVDAAAHMVFERGVAGTSLDDVGTAARVGKSQLYHYFGDKAALMRAVIARQTEQVLNVQEPYLSHLDSWEAWQAWRDLIVELQRQRHSVGGCPIGSIAAELADTDELARLELVEGFEQWEAAFRTGLARMREKGLLRRDADPDALAVATLASLQGGLLLGQTRKSTEPLEVALDAALENMRRHATKHLHASST
jgi:TetR/AcrR family transcriptional regulator, transcriptional repressor for nem operon